MNTVLKFFFYSIALVTLAWVQQSPAESVTMIEWVRLVQSPNAAIVVLLVSALLFLINLTMTGSLIGYVSKANTRGTHPTGGGKAAS